MQAHVDENIVDIHTQPIAAPQPVLADSPKVALAPKVAVAPKAPAKKQDIVGWQLNETNFKSEVAKYLDRLDTI